MSKYFDHTFFKFLFGFLIILASSFALLIAVGYYQVEIRASQAERVVDLGDSR